MADGDLLHRIRELLKAHPAGVSEYDLIQWLHEDPECPFTRPNMLDNWALFQCHFWLFHHLHLIALEWRRDGIELSVLSTNIRWQYADKNKSHVAAATKVGPPDPMQAYYLNLDNLFAETPESLEHAMNDFWHRLTARQPVSGTDWALLDVTPGASWSDIRRQYRRLCQRHHPDRGGDIQHFQAIQAAYARISQAAASSVLPGRARFP